MKTLLTGSTGQLAAYLLPLLQANGHEVIGCHSKTPQADFTHPESLSTYLASVQPDIIINTAALSTPGACHADPDLARRINTHAPQVLATYAAEHNIRLIHLSTDMVFDGHATNYSETDKPNPISIYGQTKLAGEQPVLDAGQTVVRLSLLFGPSRIGRAHFFDHQIKALQTGDALNLFDDEYRTPLSFSAAAEAIVTLGEDHEAHGLYHLGGAERLSRLEMGLQLAAVLGVKDPNIQVVSRLSIDAPEPRPADCSLDSTRLFSRYSDLKRESFSQACKNLLTVDEHD